MTAGDMLRPLSPVERWYWIADQVSPLNVIARVRLHGRLSADALERAAAALAAEYPALRVAIRADAGGRNPEFTPTAEPPPVRTVSDGGDSEWERQVNDHELTTSVDWQRGPLVRILDVVSGQTHDLVLTVAHVIADGVTVLRLLRRLIEHAHRVATRDIATVESRPAVAAPEDLLPRRHRGVRGIAGIAATGVVDQVTAAATRPRRLTPETRVPPTERTTSLIRRSLTPEQTDALLQRCRVEGVTVHGALAAAMTAVLGPAATGAPSGRVCIGSPIDFRAELVPPITADEAGAYVSTVGSIVRFGNDRDMWALASAVNRSLNRRKRMGQHLALLSALRFVCPVSVADSAKVVGLLERTGPGHLCLSNIGRYDFPARIGEWKLSGAQFIAGVSVSGYFVATVNTSHGQLFWNFTYIDDLVSEQSAHRYADDCVRTLLDAI